MSNSECLRIVDQLRRAFEGKAWHGPSLSEILSGVSAEQALAHPVSGGHSIWELVLHTEAWVEMTHKAIGGSPFPSPTPTEVDWPPTGRQDDRAWTEAVNHLMASASALGKAIEEFGDERLQDRVPGREHKYNFYFLFHGVVQHSLYHGGQIALLKKAISGR